MTKWQSVKPSLTLEMLHSLARLWFQGEKLTPEMETELKKVHKERSFGQPNFNIWSKQILRQIFENSIIKGGK